jgi:hypothetical protein
LPAAPQTGHRLVDDLEIPYVTFDSPIADMPAWEEGLNVLTSQRKVLERRPGFATPVEATPTTLPGRINNIHTWRKWSSGLGRSKGNFFIMLSVANGVKMQVWKLELGVDNSFLLLFEINSDRPFSFIDRNNWCFFGCGVQGSMMKYGGTGDNSLPWLLNWGIAAPTWVPVCRAVPVTAGVNGITCEVDYHYRATYCHEVIGGESSPSDINVCIGQFTNSEVQVDLKASPDPQVGHIRVYRSRDGGSTDPRQMQEIIGSPFLNRDQTVTDRTNDADLHNRFAPGLRRNDPPPPMSGFVSAGSRIFGFQDNTIYFSGFDEIVNGMMEECFPGSESGNFYPFNAPIEALAAMAGESNAVAVLTPDKIHQVTGDLRNEMTRATVDMLHGTRSQMGAYGMGQDVAWFDLSKQVRLSSAGEISMDIRPDVASMNAASIFVFPYVSGTRQWLCVLDSITGKLMVFDLDTKKWQVPWMTGASAMFSGEIAESKRVILAAIGNRVYYMTEGKFNDAGKPYGAFVKTNLIPLAPPNQPDVVETIDAITIERDRNDLSDIKIALDENTNQDSAYRTVKSPGIAATRPCVNRARHSLLTATPSTLHSVRRNVAVCAWNGPRRTPLLSFIQSM